MAGAAARASDRCVIDGRTTTIQACDTRRLRNEIVVHLIEVRGCGTFAPTFTLRTGDGRLIRRHIETLIAMEARGRLPRAHQGARPSVPQHAASTVRSGVRL